MSTEVIEQAPSAIDSMPRLTASELDLASLQAERDSFTGELVDRGLMTQEFAASGAMDSFLLDPMSGHDSVRHILIGDSTGGCHHLRSVMELGVDGRIVASEVYDPNRPERRRSSFVREQRIRYPEEVYGVNVVGVEEGGKMYWKQTTKTHNGKELTVNSGSSMFPDEWSAEQVLRAVMEVAALPAKPDAESGRRPVSIHDARVDGVRIRVIVDNNTGKIITASPVIAKR